MKQLQPTIKGETLSCRSKLSVKYIAWMFITLVERKSMRFFPLYIRGIYQTYPFFLFLQVQMALVNRG